MKIEFCLYTVRYEMRNNMEKYSDWRCEDIAYSGFKLDLDKGDSVLMFQA